MSYVKGEITINKLLIASIILILLFIFISIIKSVKSANIEDTIFVREAQNTYVCFEYPECYLVRYDKLKTWCKNNDITPKRYKK